MASEDTLRHLADRTRSSARKLGLLPATDRNGALELIAEALKRDTDLIVKANEEDCKSAASNNIAKALLSRLHLDKTKLDAAIQGVLSVASLVDPLGASQIHRQLDDGLILKRQTCPLGVIGVIFEARPEALIQIASLAIKSGNGVILKGGSESTQSCQRLMKTIHSALSQATSKVEPDVVNLVTNREDMMGLLQLHSHIDLVIPRGSKSLITYVQSHTRIPVLGHADGICHVYVDAGADLTKAVQIVIDSKTQYPSACNTAETLLVHSSIAAKAIPLLCASLHAARVELCLDKLSASFLTQDSTPTAVDAASLTLKRKRDENEQKTSNGSTNALNIPYREATEEDWSTEYCDLILSVKVVNSLQDAIDHINTYGSKHTEAIVSEDTAAVDLFLKMVDAAGVFHNCSTRFADGFRYGFGAEVGISTQKMPPRGPVGLEGLVTHKYTLQGNAHIVADYCGSNAKKFKHKDL